MRRRTDDQATKFRASLVPLVLNREKTSTWRLWDDNDLSVGDHVECVDETGRVFAHVTITAIVEKPLGSLTEDEKAGHERYRNDEEMYATLTGYYGRPVGPDAPVKVAWFAIGDNSQPAESTSSQ